MQQHETVGLLLRLPALGRTARPLAVAVAALVIVTMLSASRPVSVRADPIKEVPHLAVNPTCEPTPTNSDGDQITIKLSGYSFTAGQVATIYFNFQPAPAPGDAVQIDGQGHFETSFTVTEVGAQSSYAIYAYYQGAAGGEIPIAATTLYVPCTTPPSIRITPDCGPPGSPTPVHVDGIGFPDNEGVDIKATNLNDSDADYGHPAQPVTTDGGGVLSTDFTFTVPPTDATSGTVYRVIATLIPIIQLVDTATPAATAYFVAPCSQATITPSCDSAGNGPDRYSIQVGGQGFLPGLPLEIMFDPAGSSEYFDSGLTVADGNGNWGPIEINPYKRGVGVYDIVVTQFNDSPAYHLTYSLPQFTVPCPAAAGATMSPTCASPQFRGVDQQSFTIDVHGDHYVPGEPLTVSFDADQKSGPNYKPESESINAGADGSFDLPLSVLARPAGTYNVTVVPIAGSPSPPQTLPFSMPCTAPQPVITSVKRSCGDDVNVNPQPYSIVVSGKGFIPGIVEILFEGDQAPTLAPTDGNGRFQQTITTAARPQGTYTITVAQVDVSNVQLDSPPAKKFTVPCSSTAAPTLIITPNSVSPGFVVTVTGQNFGSRTTVNLSWDYGIDAGQPIQVVSGTDGSFEQQVLIFAHDFSGPREMTAGTPANPNAFPDANADLLVTAGQGLPPSYVIPGGGSTDPGSIILRR
jgi:hypothetical protein